MLEIVLVLCALAGVSAAVALSRLPVRDTRRSGLQTEHNILSRCIGMLEQPEMAAERKVLYERYQERIQEIDEEMDGRKTTNGVKISGSTVVAGGGPGVEPMKVSSGGGASEMEPGDDLKIKPAGAVIKTTSGRGKPVEEASVDISSGGGASEMKPGNSPEKPAEVGVKAASGEGKAASVDISLGDVSEMKPGDDLKIKPAGAVIKTTSGRGKPVEGTDDASATETNTGTQKDRPSVDMQDDKTDTDDIMANDDLEKIKQDIKRTLDKLERADVD